MPFFYDPNLDKENQEQDASSLNISGASPTYEENGDANQPSNNNQGLNTGSNFQNLDKYLKTNNAQDFGQKFQGKVSDQVQGAETQMSEAGNQFKNQVQSANALPTDTQINQAITDPSKADAKQFQTWQSQSYQGPKDISETQDLWNKYWSGANQAQTNTKLLGTEPGRFTLLDQYFGRPAYNFGEKSLDNLLYQESGLGNQTKALQDQAAQLTTKGQDQAQTLRNEAGKRAGEVEQNKNQVRAAIGLDDKGSVIEGEKAGAIGKEWKAVNDQLTQANQARQAKQAEMQNALNTQMFNDDQIAALGLSPDQHLYKGINPADFFTKGADLNRDQVMTPEQRARIQALSNLAGITDTFAAGTQADVTNPYSFDVDSFKTAEDARGAEYNRLWNTPTIHGGGTIPMTWDSLQSALNQGPGIEKPRELMTSEEYNNSINAFNPIKPTLSDEEYNQLLKEIASFKDAYQPDRTIAGKGYSR